MTNVGLKPGTGSLADIIGDTDDGVYMETNRSWSIDDRRLNFQFGTEIAWEIENDWDGIPEPTKKLIDEGREFGLEKYVEALALGETCRRQLPNVIGETEIILTLPAPGEAPEGLASTGSAEFNRLWTFLHVPCLHVPVDRGPTGLPIGIQLVSRRGSEAYLLATARWIARNLNLDLFG